MRSLSGSGDGDHCDRDPEKTRGLLGISSDTVTDKLVKVSQLKGSLEYVAGVEVLGDKSAGHSNSDRDWIGG